MQGVPIGASHNYTGTLLDLLNPYAMLGGLTTVGLFLLHGASYLGLKLTGAPAERVQRIAVRLPWVVTALLLAFLAWTFANAVRADNTGVVPGPIPILAIVCVAVTAPLLRNRNHGWAFTFSGVAIALTVATLFLNLYPRVLVSSTSAHYSLTITNASSTAYTLTVMTIVAAVFVPLVLLYQTWTYWVFRQRVTRGAFEMPGALRRNKPESGPGE